MGRKKKRTFTVAIPARFENCIHPGYSEEYKVTCIRKRAKGPIHVTGTWEDLSKLFGDITVTNCAWYVILMRRLAKACEVDTLRILAGMS